MTEPAAKAEATSIDRFDDAVDQLFDRLRGNVVADRIMYTASELADFSLLWHLIGATRALRSPADERAWLRLAVALGAESALVNGVIKSLFKRERPVVQQPRPHHLRVPLTTSFPSGHASAATMAAILLADGQKRSAPLYWATAALVASSRIHVRIHHASDVAGGVVVGAVLGKVAKRMWKV